MNKDYLKILFSFGKYKVGNSLLKLNENLSQIASSDSKYFAFENARSGLYIFFKSLNLPSGSSIAVQGFTCNAAVNPIIWAGLRPVYIDIDPDTLNMSLEHLKRSYNENMRAIIIQHTFGNPMQVEEVLDWARQRNIIVIEDCAHSLGVKYKGKVVGTWGDVAIYSFGLEKVLSTRSGGVLVVNNAKFLSEISHLYDQLPIMSSKDTFLWLANPLFWRFLRFTGRNQMKLASFFNSIGLINMGFYEKELEAQRPSRYPRKLPNALASVALLQLSNLENINRHRQVICHLYQEGLSGLKNISLISHEKVADDSEYKYFPLVRFPIIMDTQEMRDRLKYILENEGLYVGDWYDPVIYPKGTNLEKFFYKKGMCSTAESISKRILNLPTGMNISKIQVSSIIKLIKQEYS